MNNGTDGISDVIDSIKQISYLIKVKTYLKILVIVDTTHSK